MPVNNRLNKILLLVLLITCEIANGQNIPFLERTMSISFLEERLEDALGRISKQAGFTFSYNPSILERNRTITKNFASKTVREILDDLFEGQIEYKPRGQYIILTRTEETSSNESQMLTGYVIDEATGERLRDVSVYDPVTLSSTVTDSYGYFEIRMDKPVRDLRLSINKQNYADTLVVLPSQAGRLLSIPLRLNREKFSMMADSLGQKFRRFWTNAKVFSRHRPNLININDTIYRKAQVSLVPFVGTNRGLSGNVINEYSFNMIGGYALGIRKFEVGGIFNVVRGDVEGLQLAGVANAVGGSVRGAQLAGVFNVNREMVRGVQVAGVFNFNWDSVRHVGIAGVLNFARRGSQAIQLAGVSNLTMGDQGQPHFAGVFNFAKRNAKSQVGGVFNFAGKDLQGVQESGVANFVGKEVRGGQIAGVLNFASKVHGSQVGLINIADSVGGVPIGLISVVLKGYHKLELSSDEVFYTNLAFRTGVRKFYTIITAGANPSTFKRDETLWTFGYGLGTARRVSRSIHLNLDITSNQVVEGNSIEAINLLNKVHIGFDFQLVPKMSLAIGATVNGQITRSSYDNYGDLFSHYQPDIIYERGLARDLNLKMWVGGKVGLRFL